MKNFSIEYYKKALLILSNADYYFCKFNEFILTKELVEGEPSSSLVLQANSEIKKVSKKKIFVL